MASNNRTRLIDRLAHEKPPREEVVFLFMNKEVWFLSEEDCFSDLVINRN